MTWSWYLLTIIPDKPPWPTICSAPLPHGYAESSGIGSHRSDVFTIHGWFGGEVKAAEVDLSRPDPILLFFLRFARQVL